MTLTIRSDPALVVRAIRAAADVVEVDVGHGFCASVYLAPCAPGRSVAIARLDRSIRGERHEGAVLRWTMEHTTGIYGSGYFVYRLADRPVTLQDTTR